MLQGDQAVSRIVTMFAQEEFISRNALSRRVGEEFQFLHPVGRLQVATCTQALVDLAGKVTTIVLRASRGLALITLRGC